MPGVYTQNKGKHFSWLQDVIRRGTHRKLAEQLRAHAVHHVHGAAADAVLRRKPAGQPQQHRYAFTPGVTFIVQSAL